jgi:hypothetical protein
MHNDGKQLTSKIFRRLLNKNRIKYSRIPKFYPQVQSKIDASKTRVKNEFLAIEHIPDRDHGKRRYYIFVKAYNEERENGSINQ